MKTTTTVAAPTMYQTLKTMALWHKKRLGLTFGLVAAENLLLLTYPLVGSFAINAILDGRLAYALMVFVIWFVGSARRAIDTRVFARIYTELAIPVILDQRGKGIDTSTIAARVTLSREFVNFFEHHLPVLVTSAFSILGAVIMLLLIEFYAGVVALFIIFGFGLILPRYMNVNDRLYMKLNNRLEKEVSCVGRAKNSELVKHYRLVEWLRVRLSNRESLSFFCIGLAMSLLFGITLALLTLQEGVSAGHIYAVITYLWTFAISLDDAPRLIEELSKLRDIAQRVEVKSEEKSP